MVGSLRTCVHNEIMMYLLVDVILWRSGEDIFIAQDFFFIFFLGVLTSTDYSVPTYYSVAPGSAHLDPPAAAAGVCESTVASPDWMSLCISIQVHFIYTNNLKMVSTVHDSTIISKANDHLVIT